MEVWRYNRAESVALGLRTEWEPGAPFVSLLLRGRYAFSDRRGQVWAAVRRESPTSRLEVAAFREMRDADPLAPALGLGNSLSALWLAHDDGDYVFTEGASIRLQRSWRRSVDLVVGLRLARETAPRRLAHASLNDLLGGTGRFAPAGPVLAGTFTTAEAEAAGGRTPFSWRVGFEGSAGEGRTRVRGWLRATGGTRLPLGLGLTTSGWLGLGAGDSVPQREFRLGGLRTLRGYAAGALRGASAYVLGVDIGRERALLSPLVLADVAAVALRDVRFDAEPKVSVGCGGSALGGAFRAHAARSRGARRRLALRLRVRRGALGIRTPRP